MSEKVTPGSIGRATGVVLDTVFRVVAGGNGCDEIASAHVSSSPPTPLESSWMVSLQVPFGFSPMKAPNASSGTSGEATTEET